MSQQQSSYTQIFKATSLFGGVQIIKIIISIIRSKFVAVLLGPTGMGIAGLLTSTSGFIASITSFGLGSSAVKNVAAATVSGDDLRISKVVIVLRKLVWITGLIGMVLTGIFSPWLSQLTFGNKDYTVAFIWISITLLFDQISSGQMVILQGLRKLKFLAKANVIGLTIGLMVSIPVYYFWRIDGIVPVILISSFSSMILSWYFAKKVKIKSIAVTKKDVIIEGKDMLRLGFVLSVNGMIVLMASYLLKIYISKTAGIEQVGLYSAGFSLINSYVGMVFSAMGTDYFPRLSAIAGDNNKCRLLINQQAEIAILILAPLLTIFLIYVNWVIIMLYSAKFIAINQMIHWAMLGIIFKAASWSIAFIFIAKSATKLFLWNEILANAYTLIFNIIGYKLGGLEGLGASFFVAYVFYFLQVFLLSKLKYSFFFEKEFIKIASIQTLICILCFGTIKLLSSPWTYILGSIFIFISITYSIIALESRIGLLKIISDKLNDFKNK